MNAAQLGEQRGEVLLQRAQVVDGRADRLHEPDGDPTTPGYKIFLFSAVLLST